MEASWDDCQGCMHHQLRQPGGRVWRGSMRARRCTQEPCDMGVWLPQHPWLPREQQLISLGAGAGLPGD